MTSACAWFTVALRLQKPPGSLAQGGQLDFHTAPEFSTYAAQVFEVFFRTHFEALLSCLHCLMFNSRVRLFRPDVVYTADWKLEN